MQMQAVILPHTHTHTLHTHTSHTSTTQRPLRSIDHWFYLPTRRGCVCVCVCVRVCGFTGALSCASGRSRPEQSKSAMRCVRRPAQEQNNESIYVSCSGGLRLVESMSSSRVAQITHNAFAHKACGVLCTCTAVVYEWNCIGFFVCRLLHCWPIIWAYLTIVHVFIQTYRNTNI